eukprot:gene35964-42655_t
MLNFRLCISAILAGKKPAPLSSNAAVGAVALITPPPSLKKEATPSPREGVIWSPGYWKFSDKWFVWCSGHWELSRPDQLYVAPHWEHYADGWHFIAAAWRPDPSVGKTARSRDETPAYDML